MLRRVDVAVPWSKAGVESRGGKLLSASHPALLMQRRDFLKIAGVAAASSPLVGLPQQSFLTPAVGPQDVAKTDFTLQIEPITVELAPNRILSTIGYNGTS